MYPNYQACTLLGACWFWQPAHTDTNTQDPHQPTHDSWTGFQLRYLIKKCRGHSQESLLWPGAEPVYGTTRHQ